MKWAASLLPLLALLLAAAAPRLPSGLDTPATGAGWIWQQAQAGEVADFNDRCGTPLLDIRKTDDDRWRSDCRRVDPGLLRVLLTQPDLADNTPHGVRIRGARIEGTLDLDDAHVRAAEITFADGWIEGDVVLSDARLDGQLNLDRSLVAGAIDLTRTYIGDGLSLNASIVNGRFSAASAQIGQHLVARGTRFGSPVSLRIARVEGPLDMSDASIAKDQLFDAERLRVGHAGLFLLNVEFGGGADLKEAQIDGQAILSGAHVADGRVFDADGLRVGSGGLFLRKMTFGGPVEFGDAAIDGQLDMDGVSVAEGQMFHAQRLHVGYGGLFMRDVTFGGPVDLLSARVDSGMSMDRASTAKDQSFIAQRLRVGPGGLSMLDVTFGGPVNLLSAHVEGRMTMQGGRVAAGHEFNAQQLRVGSGGLSMNSGVFGGEVDLLNAFVEGQLDLDQAKFAAAFTAQHLHVGLDFIARGAVFGGDVSLQLLRLEGLLNLRGSRMRVLHLESADIQDDLALAGMDGPSEQWVHWETCPGPASCLNLRNARIGNLQDDERAWPERITLEGFSYTHLGGADGELREDMRNRPIAWWRGWLERDPVYSAQPYTQLASVLAAAGNRDGAADIRFYGRDRERSELLRGCRWLQALGLVKKPLDDRPCGVERWATWAGLTALQVFVGYGIGAYGFRAVGWALVFSLIGTVILCFAPGVRGPLLIRFLGKPRHAPRQRSLLWCFGASLNRLLPLVTISQEFNDFFDDPGRQRLLAWQQLAFGILALCGWVLGLFVVAAFSGLIQN